MHYFREIRISSSVVDFPSIFIEFMFNIQNVALCTDTDALKINPASQIRSTPKNWEGQQKAISKVVHAPAKFINKIPSTESEIAYIEGICDPLVGVWTLDTKIPHNGENRKNRSVPFPQINLAVENIHQTLCTFAVCTSYTVKPLEKAQ